MKIQNPNISDTNRRRLARICMCACFLIGFTFSFVSEKVPKADGAGWDGELYKFMCEDFVGMWQNGQISSYYLQKCLPFAMVNGVSTILGVTDSYSILVIFHYIFAFLALYGFFKISSFFKLRISIEIIVFSLTFITLKYLKFVGFYPYSGDAFAFSLAIWFYYFFITKKQYPMLLLSVVGAFAWQSILPLSLILFTLPQNGYNIIDERIEHKEKLILNTFKILLLIVVAMIPVSILLYAKSQGGWWLWSTVIPYCFFTLPKWVLLVSSLAIFALVYFIVKPLNFSIPDFVQYLYKNLSRIHLAIAVAVFVSFKMGIFFLSNPSLDPPISSKELLLRLFWEPYILPAKFLSTHLATCGLLLPLFVLLYKPILKVISEHSVAYIIAIAMLLFFGLQSETRYVLNFFPFVIFPIGVVLNDINFKSWVPYALFAIQLFYSGIWRHINTPELSAVLENGDSFVYAHSDLAQRYFYFYGPWQGLKAYAIFMAQFVVIMSLLYIGRKRKWFVNNEK